MAGWRQEHVFKIIMKRITLLIVLLTSLFQLNANGNVLCMTEPGGKLTEWTYDSRNRKLSEKISGENCESIERNWTYDNVGNIKTLTEGGCVTSYTYDCLNNLLETDFPDGQKEINEYDKLNRVIKITNASGAYKAFAYNSLNLVTRQKDEDDKYTDFKYDVWGNQTWRNERNSEGSGDQIWDITYNAFGQPVREEKNDGTKWSYEYNGRGLLTKKTDPKGIVLSNTYDACGRLLSETRKFGGKTETKNYTYDANGFMYAASDNGVVSRINFENGNYKANAYDLVTSLETSVAGKKLNSSYSYDDALNMTELSYPDGSKADYAYNALGQLTAISGGSTKYARNGSYDSLGRLISLTAGNGKETTRTWNSTTGTLSGYSWDLDDYVARSLEWNNLGNITSISKGTSQRPYTNTYQYDNVGRLTYEHNGAEAEVSTKESKKTSFLYVQNDVSGKNKGIQNSEIVKLDYYAGSAIVDLEAVQKLTSIKVFGKNNRIKPEHLEVWLSEDNDLWQRDTNISWENCSEGWKVIFAEETEARYVKLHSLWDERDEDYIPEDHSTYSGNLWNLFEVNYIAEGKENTYDYDARGNRLREIEAYTGSNGRLTDYEYYANSDLIKRAGNWYFNYDKNGNLIARGTVTISSNETVFSAWTFSETDGELWTYEYDLQNRMTKASYSGKGSANLKERGSYVYDYRGLLVKNTYQNYNPNDLVEVVNEDESKPVTEFYEYTADGRVLYNESIEGDSTKKTTYIWANTTLWCEINEGVVYYHHTDHLGTTEVVTDQNGKVVWEAGYEAFGSVLSERGDSSFTPSYTGKFFDKASGLYYFNARWYDSELGKFTTSDPIRDGLNWWNYCNGNPIIRIDYNGLETWRSSTLTREQYDKNFTLQQQYSWEQIQQHFSDNPNGIIYRYDSAYYSLGSSNKDFPNMEKPSGDMVLLFSGFSGMTKRLGETAIKMLKNAVKSAATAFTFDALVQTKNAAKTGKFDFDVNESINATAGGFVSGFVSGGISELPKTHGATSEQLMLLGNMMGGISGSMTSQLLNNIENGNFIGTGMDNALINGTAGGGMVGCINIFFPSPLPTNTVQILRDGLKDEFISAATTEVIKKK